MIRTLVKLAILPVLAGTCLFADFSYDSTTTLTGGMMARMMKLVSKQMREPIRTTVVVKGDRMAHISPQHIQIIDLSKETITSIDPQRKTYSVVTFQQMADALKQMQAKMRDEKGQEKMDITVKPSVKQTGQTRQISGLDAREAVLTIEMEGTDKKTGQKGVFMVMTSHMWLAPNAAGFDEVRNFQKRMAQKLDWSPGGNLFTQGRSDMAKGMAELYKESAALDGMPVYQVTMMGAQAPQQTSSGGAAPVEQQQPQQQAQPEPEKPSVGAALGRLGGRFGGLGRRKGKPSETQPQAETAPPPAEAQGQPNASGALMEMTTELSGFSSETVDASRLEIPAGFKQVEDETLKSIERGR